MKTIRTSLSLLSATIVAAACMSAASAASKEPSNSTPQQVFDGMRQSFQDPVIAPGGGIIWLFSDKLRLQAVFPKPALVYEPNDDWEIRAIGELNFLGARTDDVLTTERKLQLHDAVVQYSEYRAGLQVAYSGFKHFKIIAGAGATIQRNFDFFRANQSKRIDPAPYLRIAAEAKF